MLLKLLHASSFINGGPAFLLYYTASMQWVRLYELMSLQLLLIILRLSRASSSKCNLRVDRRRPRGPIRCTIKFLLSLSRASSSIFALSLHCPSPHVGLLSCTAHLLWVRIYELIMSLQPILIILRLSRASPSILLLVYHFIAHDPISFLYPPPSHQLWFFQP